MDYSKIRNIVIIVGLFCIVSCQKQEINNNPAPMSIQFIHPSAVTRATETAFESGDKIGLYVVETPAPLQVSGNYVNNLQATYNGSLWTGHKLSKITLKLVKGTDYVGDLPSTAVFYVHSTVPGATVDLTTGSVTKDPYGTAKTITCHKVDDATYEAVIVPQRLASRTPLFEMVANGVSYLVEGSFNFKPGINYTFNVTLNTSTESIRIEIGGEIADWN